MEESNSPYQAPQSEIASDEMLVAKVEPASRLLRFLNLIIDYAGFFALALLIGIAIGFFGGEQALSGLDGVSDYLIGIVIVLLYYVPLEATTGRTIGKLITGTKVVNQDGGKPSFMQIIGRTLCRFIPFEAFSFFFEGGRGFHDSIPKTYVIKCR